MGVSLNRSQAEKVRGCRFTAWAVFCLGLAFGIDFGYDWSELTGAVYPRDVFWWLYGRPDAAA